MHAGRHSFNFMIGAESDSDTGSALFFPETSRFPEQQIPQRKKEKFISP